MTILFLSQSTTAFETSKMKQIIIVEVVGSSPIKALCCFLEQETLPLLLSTGWFQERNRA